MAGCGERGFSVSLPENNKSDWPQMEFLEAEKSRARALGRGAGGVPPADHRGVGVPSQKASTLLYIVAACATVMSGMHIWTHTSIKLAR